MKTFRSTRVTLLLAVVLAASVSVLTAADPRRAQPRDPSNATNLYYVIKRLKEQQRQQKLAQQRRIPDYRMGHQKIKQKLSQIRFKEIMFDGLTLDEVLQFISEEIRRQDPEKKGINFMYISPSAAPVQLNAAGAGTGVPGGLDPNAGANPGAADTTQTAVLPPPLAAAPPELSSVIINLRQPLRNLTAAQVLDVVAKTADQPIQFGVNNYSIVAMPRAPGSGNISGTRLRANPDTFGGGNLVNPVMPTLPFLGNQSGQGQGQGGRIPGN